VVGRIAHIAAAAVLKPSQQLQRRFSAVYGHDGRLQPQYVATTLPVRMLAIGCIHGNTKRLEESLAVAVRRSADCVCLLGDFCDDISATTPKILQIISDFHKAQPDITLLAILGNNDVFYAALADTEARDGCSVSHWRTVPSRLTESLADVGVRVLQNEKVTLRVRGKNIVLYGAPELELFPPYGNPDPWLSRAPRLSLLDRVGLRLGIGFARTACGRMKPGKGFRTAEAARVATEAITPNLEDVSIILAHNPDWVYNHQVLQSGALVISSHTHGLQHGLPTLCAVLRNPWRATRFGFSTFSGYAAGNYTVTPENTACSLVITAGLVGERYPGSGQAPDYLWISNESM
jgi:predicted MPP superfamily phosphohydrolase